MIRLRLLIPVILFLSLSPEGELKGQALHYPGVWTFLSGFLAMILFPAMLARIVARRADGSNVRERMIRVSRTINLFRHLVPIWFAAGLWYFQWGLAVRIWLRWVPEWMMTPAVVLGIAPAIIAWIGLIWAQYPCEVLLRQHTVLDALEDDFPIYMPARLIDFLDNQVRMQVLSTIVPMLFAMILHDIIAGGLVFMDFGSKLTRWGVNVSDDTIETILFTAAMAVVFVTSPKILRLVFNTEPLPDSTLRARLEKLFARTRLKCNSILLWHTHRNVANAMVAGPTRFFRYIFLSDLLTETLTDEQIEAVFAHEAGHIAHHHIAWYLSFVMTITMLLAGPSQWLEKYLQDKHFSADTISSGIGLLTFLLFWMCFGMLSRRFERQADVYAARALQLGFDLDKQAAATQVASPNDSSASAQSKSLSHEPNLRPTGYAVGKEGADTFASALERVAIINNIPLEPRPWTPGLRGFFAGVGNRIAEFFQRFMHGSIRTRMNYVRSIADDAEKTFRFDRKIKRLKIALFIAFLASSASALWLVKW